MPQWNAYAYADKAQEAKRRESECKKTEAQKKASETRALKRKRNTPWSQQTVNKEEKNKRKLKKDRKRQWLKSQATVNHNAMTPVKSQSAEDSRDDGDGGDDWDELAKEERLAKKVRKGTATQQVFDAEFGDL